MSAIAFGKGGHSLHSLPLLSPAGPGHDLEDRAIGELWCWTENRRAFLSPPSYNRPLVWVFSRALFAPRESRK